MSDQPLPQKSEAMKLRPMEWLIIAAIAVTIFLFVYSGGGVGHFSPDTLDYKTRSHDILCWPTYHRTKLTEYLIEKDFWSPHPTSSPRWILMFEWWPGTRDGDLGLHRELTGSKGDEWIEWSEKHPERAAVLWPQVITLLRADPDGGPREAVELLWTAQRRAIHRGREVICPAIKTHLAGLTAPHAQSRTACRGRSRCCGW